MIDNDDALRDIDLNSRETDARRVVHRLEHIVHQFFHFGVDGCDRRCLIAQAWVRVVKISSKAMVVFAYFFG